MNFLVFCIMALMALVFPLQAQVVSGEILPDPGPEELQSKGRDRQAISSLSADSGILPHLAFGGYWESFLSFTNTHMSESSCTALQFFDQSGKRTTVSFSVDPDGRIVTGNVLHVQLPPNGHMRIRSLPQPGTSIVWAETIPSTSAWAATRGTMQQCME